MLDEEKVIEQELHTNVTSPPTLPSSRTANHSGATTDEESQIKRRAPDFHLTGSSLTKRPSVKSFGGKRRPRNNSGSDEGRLANSSNPVPSPSSVGSGSSLSRGIASMVNAPVQGHIPPADSGIHDMDTS
jgi:hypothetical protein